MHVCVTSDKTRSPVESVATTQTFVGAILFFQFVPVKLVAMRDGSGGTFGTGEGRQHLMLVLLT